jgi:hypothetical protein
MKPLVNRGEPDTKLVLYDICFSVEVLSDPVELDSIVGLQY